MRYRLTLCSDCDSMFVYKKYNKVYCCIFKSSSLRCFCETSYKSYYFNKLNELELLCLLYCNDEQLSLVTTKSGIITSITHSI